MDNELVSIITPSYNSSQFIKECVSSVLRQTYRNWELIIVDDCSRDNSRNIIRDLAKKDTRINTVFLQKNVGAAEARNIAIRKARGKYIAFLDSDDIWLENKLKKQIKFMRDAGIAFSFTSYNTINEHGNKILNTVSAPEKMTYNAYLKDTVIGCLTVVVDIEKVGSFEMPDIKISEDMALWLKILKRGFIAYGLNEVLSQYRVSSNSLSKNKINALVFVWKVYREVEKLSLFYSIYCFCCYVINAIKKRI
jgi:teichuronic acid biosynthesis glycosyltransferase TuaG